MNVQFSLFLFPHRKNLHCHLPNLAFETKSVSLFLEYKHPENSKFQGYHWENLVEAPLLSVGYSLGLFFSNSFKEEVELLKVKQSLSGLQVITCLDWIKKRFKIIET